MKRILILGCGYLGLNLANYFCKKNYDVSVIGRKSVYSNFLEEEIEFIEDDIKNINSYKHMFNEETTVIYAIGSINANNYFMDLRNDIENSYIPFINLLNFLSEKYIQKFVFLSSAGTVYGNVNKNYISENEILNPISIYGLQKAFFEQLIRIKNNEASHFRYLIFRISNPYGGINIPNKNQGIIPTLVYKAVNNEPFELWASINTIRDYIYIDDLSELIYKTIYLDIYNETLNLGSGKGTSIKQLISLVEEILGKKITILEKPPIKTNVLKNILDISKLVNTVGYEPKISIEEGISRYINTILTKNIF
ncbi:UDP-glucose 4-epimerase [Anoxybacillus tepidamans]|uniref:Fcd n=1 Tax=Anoxybacteroides tepidamans TaxID=265948 RepID=A2BD24_9BACL|nr:NAD-dependent epimerase/dehydratase family protein [Anoxybacillus tepidamans]ABM68324.1 Fcd [Anoxybacillus tepidamans]MBB5324205.1 UDP-glucose 4-epimerase [Anoxybacillus tepidamans]